MTLYREDVKVLHGVHCYSDEWALTNKPEATDNSIGGRPYNSWGATCICHHEVWHSCPDSKLGKTIWSTLPSMPRKDGKDNTVTENQQIIALLTSIDSQLRQIIGNPDQEDSVKMLLSDPKWGR